MKIIVRAAEPADYDAIQQTMLQPLAQAETLQLPYTSRETWRKRATELAPGDHILVAEVDGQVVGNLGLHSMAKSARRRHIGYIGISVHDEWHGNGVGTALMKAAIELADNWLQYTRLELTVYVDNAAALALYKKFGFEIEGTLRRYAFRRGEYVDAYMMSRLK